MGGGECRFYFYGRADFSEWGQNPPQNPQQTKPEFRSFAAKIPHCKDLPLTDTSTLFFRGRKRHINIWHINNFSVTPVTDPPGREPNSSRPGTRTKTLMFLGFRTQHINFWPLATGRENPPPHPVGRPPPHLRSHQQNLFMFMCLFLSWVLGHGRRGMGGGKAYRAIWWGEGKPYWRLLPSKPFLGACEVPGRSLTVGLS